MLVARDTLLLQHIHRLFHQDAGQKVPHFLGSSLQRPVASICLSYGILYYPGSTRKWSRLQSNVQTAELTIARDPSIVRVGDDYYIATSK